MALEKIVITDTGLRCSNAYIRVEGLSLIKKDEMNFFVRSYVDKDKQPFSEKIYYCAYDLNGANPIAQAYAHLKTLPDFADAVDC